MKNKKFSCLYSIYCLNFLTIDFDDTYTFLKIIGDAFRADYVIIKPFSILIIKLYSFPLYLKSYVK